MERKGINETRQDTLKPSKHKSGKSPSAKSQLNKEFIYF